MPLFGGKSSKNPADVVRTLKEALLTLESKTAPLSSGETTGKLLYC